MKIYALNSKDKAYIELVNTVLDYVSVTLCDELDSTIKLVGKESFEGFDCAILNLDDGVKKIDKIIKKLKKKIPELFIILKCNDLDRGELIKHQSSKFGADLYYNTPTSPEFIRETLGQLLNIDFGKAPVEINHEEILDDHKERVLFGESAKGRSSSLDNTFATVFPVYYENHLEKAEEITSTNIKLSEFNLEKTDPEVEFSLTESELLQNIEPKSEELSFFDESPELEVETDKKLEVEIAFDDEFTFDKGDSLVVDTDSTQSESISTISELNLDGPEELSLDPVLEINDESYEGETSAESLVLDTLNDNLTIDSLDLSLDEVEVEDEDNSAEIELDSLDESLIIDSLAFDLSLDDDEELDLSFDLSSKEEKEEEEKEEEEKEGVESLTEIESQVKEASTTHEEETLEIGESTGFDLDLDEINLGHEDSIIPELKTDSKIESIASEEIVTSEAAEEGEYELDLELGLDSSTDTLEPELLAEADESDGLELLFEEKVESTVVNDSAEVELDFEVDTTVEVEKKPLSHLSHASDILIPAEPDDKTHVFKMPDLGEKTKSFEHETDSDSGSQSEHAIEIELDSDEEETSAINAPTAYQAPMSVEVRDEEMIRMGETIKVLKADREQLLEKIMELEGKTDQEERDFIDLNSTIEEQRIELVVAKKRYEKEISHLRDQLNMVEEKKDYFKEKNKKTSSDLENLSRKKHVDLNKVKVRERELEDRLEMLKSDAEVQLRNRDHKILDLKRRIDTLEFDMRSSNLKEKKVSIGKMELEERMEQVISTLRGAIGQLEEKESEVESEKKRIDV